MSTPVGFRAPPGDMMHRRRFTLRRNGYLFQQQSSNCLRGRVTLIVVAALIRRNVCQLLRFSSAIKTDNFVREEC